MELMRRYNIALKAIKNAEEYFKTHTIEECEKHIVLFNIRTKELSVLIKPIERKLGRKMTRYELLNGFKGV